MVRIWSTSEKMSLGSDPPRLGSTAGFFPVVRASEAAAQDTHGSSGSSREATNMSVRLLASFTMPKPWRSRWRRSAGRMSSGSTPTTQRSWHRAQALGGTALTGVSGLPAFMARMSNEHQPYSCSAGVRPPSPQPESMVGPSGPPLTSQSARARRTDAGISFGTHPGMRMRPVGDTIVDRACTSCTAGSDSRPPQLPE